MTHKFDFNKFFLGTLCKRGHDYERTKQSLRTIKKRSCVECLKLTNQRNIKSRKEKYNQDAEYRSKLLQQNVESRARHHEKYKEKQREYSNNRDKDKRRAYLAEYNKQNREIIRAKDKARCKIYRNSERGKTIYKAHLHNRRARRIASEINGNYTPEQWQQQLERFGHSCAYCHAKVKLTIDHIEAISKGGANLIDNVVPACATCNSSKGCQNWYDWFLEQDFFNEESFNLISYVIHVMKHEQQD